jgi:PPOX class probable F420-dependent enzyme
MATLEEPARAFVEHQRVGHLATVDATGVPQVIPICFALIDQTLYVAIDEKPKQGDPSKLRRLRNIAANPHVAIVVDVYDDRDWSKLGFVLVRCSARVLVDGAEHALAVAALRERYVQYRAMRLDERPVIAADIERVTTWGQLDQAPRTL